ncbi:MAG: hypothetical protein ACT4PO_12930 [Actinomycetota bacterium]
MSRSELGSTKAIRLLERIGRAAPEPLEEASIIERRLGLAGPAPS